ncbi:hypothetical protein COOONC_15407 [Cooperia oncophora]
METGSEELEPDGDVEMTEDEEGMQCSEHAKFLLISDVSDLRLKYKNHLQQISSCYCYYFGCDDRRAVQLYIDTLEPELYL